MNTLSKRLGVANGAIIPKFGLAMSYLLLGLYVILSIVSLPKRGSRAAKAELRDTARKRVPGPFTPPLSDSA